MKISQRLKNRLAEALIAALTVFITALTTVSCMSVIPAFNPLSPLQSERGRG